MTGSKSFYVRHEDPVGLSVLDVVPYESAVHKYITRVRVPDAHRGKGHGRDLVQQCTRWADENRYTLHLEIGSYGPLDSTELRNWFGRNGFRGPPGGPMRRRPQS